MAAEYWMTLAFLLRREGQLKTSRAHPKMEITLNDDTSLTTKEAEASHLPGSKTTVLWILDTYFLRSWLLRVAVYSSQAYSEMVND